MLVETDREKYAIQRIVNFYERQPTDYADYFRGGVALQASRRARKARRHAGRHRGGGKAEPEVSADGLADPRGDAEAAKQEVGPIAKLQAMWRALPAPGAKQPERSARKCVEMRDFVVRIRKHTAMEFAAPVVKGLSRRHRSR